MNTQDNHIQDTRLGEAFGMVSAFCGMTEAQRVHVTLWAAASHVFREFPAFARLDFSAVGPGCGKSTALEVVTSLCPEPLVISYSTQGSLKNYLDEYPNTTIGLDERDAIFGTMGRTTSSRSELISMMNAGYAADGKMLATRGGKAVQIPVYNAVAHAGIGRAYPALADRSVTITLEKQMPDEQWVSVLYSKHMTAIGKDLGEWINGAYERMQLSDMPNVATIPGDPRHKLIMAPLEAVATVAGMREQFADAEAEIMTGIASAPILSRSQMLIRDVAAMLPPDASGVVTAEEIRALLTGNELWSALAPGRIGDRSVASLLREQGIEATGGKNGWGYRVEAIALTCENSVAGPVG